MVKRYDPELISPNPWSDECTAEMEECSIGEYVEHKDYEALMNQVDELSRATQWHKGSDKFPCAGKYVVKFYLDQGSGHGHFEELLCEHDPSYGDDVVLRPDFSGVGSPSIVSWYGPIPPDKEGNQNA